MGPEIVFVPSAFKHKFSEENIRWVLLNHLVDGIIEEDNETKYLSIGFDKSGNLLEVMYNLIDERTIKVFHAMRCRRQFYEMLKEQEKLW
jgi:exonuclease I